MDLIATQTSNPGVVWYDKRNPLPRAIPLRVQRVGSILPPLLSGFFPVECALTCLAVTGDLHWCGGNGGSFQCGGEPATWSLHTDKALG